MSQPIQYLNSGCPECRCDCAPCFSGHHQDCYSAPQCDWGRALQKPRQDSNPPKEHTYHADCQCDSCVTLYYGHRADVLRSVTLKLQRSFVGSDIYQLTLTVEERCALESAAHDAICFHEKTFQRRLADPKLHGKVGDAR